MLAGLVINHITKLAGGCAGQSNPSVCVVAGNKVIRLPIITMTN